MGVRNIQPGITHAGTAEEADREAYASIRESAHSLHSNRTAHQTPGHQTGLGSDGLIAGTATGALTQTDALLDRGTQRSRKDRQR
jgi:hypothetical protein